MNDFVVRLLTTRVHPSSSSATTGPTMLFCELVGRFGGRRASASSAIPAAQEIKGMGDGLMAVFRSATGAVACGIRHAALAVGANGRRNTSGGMASVTMRVGLSAAG
jgi:class 3 adenylate cyclase